MDKIFGKMFNFGEKKPKGETPYEGVESYTYFDHVAERHDIYEFCKELTEYLAKNKVRNIMFIDRGARGAWVGVHEYWKRQYPDREMPNLYFINPDVVSDNLQQKIEAYSFITAIAGVEADVVSQLRPGDTKDAQDKFSDTYTRLMGEKDQPLVLFDTCSHTGQTLIPLLSMLKNLNFTNFKVLTASRPDFVSTIKTDKILDRRALLHNCYPFGSNSLVKKGKDIISERDDSANKARGVTMRREIRQIIRDQGKK